MTLLDVQNFLGQGDIAHGIEVTVQEKDLNRADVIADRISKKLGPSIIAKDWMSMNRNLFAAFKLEKIGMFICMTLIIIVAALNIRITSYNVCYTKLLRISSTQVAPAVIRPISRHFSSGVKIAFAPTSDCRKLTSEKTSCEEPLTLTVSFTPFRVFRNNFV